jgi:hypothetical protein
MGRLVLIAAALLGVVIVAGGLVLAFWDIAPPARHTEHVVPDAKLAH